MELIELIKLPRTPTCSMSQVNHTKTIRQFVAVGDLHVIEHCAEEQSSRGPGEIYY